MRVDTRLAWVSTTPLGTPVLPLVYMMMAGVAGRGAAGSASTLSRLLLAVFLPRLITSQYEMSCRSPRKPSVLVLRTGFSK